MVSADPVLARRLRITSAVCGAVAVSSGLIVLIAGWWLGIEGLRTLIPRDTSFVRPNGALVFISAGVAVIAVALDWPRWISLLAAATVTALGWVSLLEHALSIESAAFDRALVASNLGPELLRIPLSAAIAFSILGPALILLSLRLAPNLRQVLGTIVFCYGAAALFAFILQIPVLMNVISTQITGMALNAAPLLILLGFGVVCADLEPGFARVLASRLSGGRVTRFLLPLKILLVLLVVVTLRLAFLADADGPRITLGVLFGLLLALLVGSAFVTGTQADRVDERRLAAIAATEQRARRSEALQRLTVAMTENMKLTSPDFDAVAELVLTAMPEAQFVGISALTSDGEHLRSIGSAHRYPEVKAYLKELLSAPVPVAGGLAEASITSGTSSLISPISRELAFAMVPSQFSEPLERYGLGALIQSPITTANGIFGLIAIASPPAQELSEDDRDFTDEIARVLGLALTTSQLWGQLLEANAALESRVAERTAELTRAQAQLEDSVEALARSNQDLRRFAYVASHDLQAPLRTVGGFTELMINSIGLENLNEEQRRMAQFITEGTSRMQQLIRDLLEYTRVGSEQGATEVLPISSACAEVTELLSADIEATSATACALPSTRSR